jgi:gliding motility-associated protein GldE
MAYPLYYLDKFFSPFNKILIRSTNLISKKLQSYNPTDQLAEEISQVLEKNPESESSEEKEILEGIVTFGNKNVAEIMCPRTDVVALDARTSFARVLELINESGYSRIPVYEDSFDHIRGILYIKDLLPHTDKEISFQWLKLLRTPFFVPGSRLIKDLLEDFQKNKIHLAVVVDEFGGFSGIVTLEDVLEEIVGDIADEQDGDESLFTRNGEKKFLFEGKIPLDKFCKITGYHEDYFSSVRRDADTLAGLVLEINGDIPKLNDVILFGNIRFTVESVTSRRIEKIMVDYT